MSIVLRDYQQRFGDYLDRGGKRAVLVAHRRAGKDLVALHQIFRAASLRVGTYWYLLPTYSQSRRVIWQGRFGGQRLLDVIIPRDAIARVHETDMFVELRNGSLIQFLGSDTYDRLVGANPLGVVFSEYALSKPQAWQYIRPIVKQNNGWVAWLSTPRGRNDLFRIYEIAKKDPSWFCEKLSIHDTKALPAEILEEELRHGMPQNLIASEYLVSFDSAQVGSVYGDLLEKMEARQAITTWDVKDAIGVFTSWDLGFADSTAIWFWRVEKERVDLIDYYESNGKPLSHYCDIIEERGYTYTAHFLPHDARARNYQTGVTTLELARERLGSAVKPLPILPVQQGIEALRWLLQQDIRIHSEKCEAGLAALRDYSYEFDEERRTFSDRPSHSWSSHGADAARYLATSVRPMIRRMKPTPAEKAAEERPGFFPVTLEKMWEDRESSGKRRQRIP